MAGDLVVEPVTHVDADALLGLYDAVGWSSYTRAPQVLEAAIAGSSYVVTARRDDLLPAGRAGAAHGSASRCRTGTGRRRPRSVPVGAAAGAADRRRARPT